MPPKPNTVKTKVGVSTRYIRQVFGVSDDAVRARGLRPVGGKYDLEEFWRACRELICEKFLKEVDSASDGNLESATLKVEKLAQEVRKLSIENDMKVGLLVPAEDVAETYSSGLKAMCDVLDAIPSRLKMQVPDISQAVLDAVNTELAEARNKAVDRLSE